MTDTAEFARLADPFRAELLAHCYRMLGSVHDAEDQVQETLLRAWRSYGDFEGRASLRTWLYRIATNTCLRALENRSRRPLPSGLGAPGANAEAPLAAAQGEVPWLEPIPDALVRADPANPASIVASRASLRLALIAALQYLPARQRAVLILRDVLQWRASEVADLLGISTTAVNGLLLRARARIGQAGPGAGRDPRTRGTSKRALLDKYAAAFQNADVPALSRLLQGGRRLRDAADADLVRRARPGRPVPRHRACYASPATFGRSPTPPTASPASRATCAAATAGTTPSSGAHRHRRGNRAHRRVRPGCSRPSACRRSCPPRPVRQSHAHER